VSLASVNVPGSEGAIQGLVWITVPIGLTLVGLAMLDVFLTVLHIQVESPLSNYLDRHLWQLLVRVSRRLPEQARDEVLAWGAPLMIGGIVVFWSTLYVVGFGLLYVPYVHDPSAFSIAGVQPQSALEDALYFSALSFFTLGYGEIVPVHPIARLLAVLQGALGLTTLSLSVTYLLSVYPLIARKIGLAASLNLETGGRSDGVILAERYVRGGRYEALAQRLAEVNDELLKLGQSHGLYPVLYYIRPREVHHSFVRVLAIVQGIVATLRYGLDPDEYPDVVTDPRLLILEEGLLSTLHTLAASSHLAAEGASREDLDLARRDHLALTESLRQRGLVAASPEDRDALAGHARFRAATEHYIRAYAANSGYDVDAVHAQYSRWDRDTALVGHAETDGQSRTRPGPVAAVQAVAGDEDDAILPVSRPVACSRDARTPN
jgi:hypothetical protein